MFAFGMAATISSAYEIATHGAMTEQSIISSQFIPFLQRLGLDPAQNFPFSRPAPDLPFTDLRPIDSLIIDGSQEEDSLLPLPRVFNHFFDPAHNNRGLFVPPLPEFPSSPDWALEDSGSRGPFLLQEHSFRDAREALFAALTRKAKADRDVEFGQTFRALGQIVHHLQDMAQLQHVRNDAHIG